MLRFFPGWLVCVAVLLAHGCATAGSERQASAAPDTASASAAERQILVTLTDRPSPPLRRAGTTSRIYARPAGYRMSTSTRRAVADLASRYELRQVADWPIDTLGVYCVVFEIPDGRARAELLRVLAGDPRVESAQAMQVFEVLGGDYNDPYLHLQYGVQSMQVQQAHRWAVGRGVRVAVIDTGVDVDHPELAGRIAAAEDFVEGDAANFASDVHGTAVAGVIASSVNNGIGIVGVAPDVSIMALKACWQRRLESPAAVCNSFTLAKAISFAVDKHPQLLNLSLTGPADPLLERLIAAAMETGIIVVAADDGSAGFPSYVDGVVSVRSASPDDDVSAPPPTSPLIAPGVDILTTMPQGAYDFVSGSSFAAAHVSGIAALLLELQPTLSAASIETLLRETSGNSGSGENSGPGVNACAALAEIVRDARCPAGVVARVPEPLVP